MNQSSEPVFSPLQTLNQVLIETPLRQQTLTGIAYIKAKEKLLQDIQLMYQSDFYESINIHYGAKSKFQMQGNLQEVLQKRKKEILKLKIVEQQNCIKKIMSARDPIDIERIQKDYETNLSLIQERENNFDKGEFIPWIYVQAKKKKPLYGKIFQQFDRKGAAMLKSTIGYRAPVSIFDRIEFNMETLPIQYLRKRQYYVFGLNWMMPKKLQNKKTADISISTQNSCSPIFKDIDEKKISGGLSFSVQGAKIQLDIAKRSPIFFDNIYENCRKDLFRPSQKFSVKVEKTIKDTLQKGDIMSGQYIQTKFESTLPLFLSQSKYSKFDFSFRKFYDLYNVGQLFENKKIKSLFRNSNFETNFSSKAILNLTQYVSDMPEKFEIRGFENDRSPDQSILQAKGSFKFNNYNYPLFGSVGIVPFLYGQGGIAVNKKIKKSHILGSVGIGVSYPLNKFIHLQVLYALMQGQNYSKRQPVNFQIRIGFMD